MRITIIIVRGWLQSLFCVAVMLNNIYSVEMSVVYSREAMLALSESPWVRVPPHAAPFASVRCITRH